MTLKYTSPGRLLQLVFRHILMIYHLLLFIFYFIHTNLAFTGYILMRYSKRFSYVVGTFYKHLNSQPDPEQLPLFRQYKYIIRGRIEPTTRSATVDLSATAATVTCTIL